MLIRNRIHSGWSPFEMVSIRDGVHSGLCLFGVVSIRDGIHSRLCPFGIVSIRDCVFWDRVQDPIPRHRRSAGTIYSFLPSAITRKISQDITSLWLPDPASLLFLTSRLATVVLDGSFLL